jgi:hypothetical protein
MILGCTALCVAQQEGQRQSSCIVPSRALVRASRHPCCALMSVCSELVSGDCVRQSTQS